MNKITLSAIAFLSLSACGLSPDYVRPDAEVPLSWEGTDAKTMSNIDYQWWKSFNDDNLNNLMTLALSKNTDVQAGVHVVEQSRVALKIAGADLWPAINAKSGASSTNTNPNNGSSFDSERLSVGLSVSYELDIFGANRASKNSAQANFISSVYAQDALELIVMADVAQAYFTLLNLNERLQIAEENLSSRREVLRIIQVRVDEGVDSDLELAQQTSLVASAEASRSQIIESTTNAKNALAVLLGQPPQAFDITKVSLDKITVPEIAVGQPSELLDRRPDLKAAEANLIAANADIGVAKAALYPSVSLGIDDTLSITGFGDPSANILTFAADIVAPIFQGGRLKGRVEQVTARQLELVENYRGAVYTAFQDVENGLAAVQSAQQRADLLKTVMEQSMRAYTLSKILYDAGSIDFQTLLDTQISLLSAEDAYA